MINPLDTLINFSLPLVTNVYAPQMQWYIMIGYKHYTQPTYWSTLSTIKTVFGHFRHKATHFRLQATCIHFTKTDGLWDTIPSWNLCLTFNTAPLALALSYNLATFSL